ncbi:MAG: PorT family protein [Tannerella sp.]|jgi:hypothetical protein|nr:PorT family protein [Tannerella sp.]
MKKTVLTSAFLMFAICLLMANGFPSDTTFLYGRKMITIADGNDQINVKVFEQNDWNDTIPYKQLYEGIFSDEKNYERWTVHEALGFDIPFLRKKNTSRRYMPSHWDGIGFGFANIADQSLNMTDIDGMSVNAGTSYEWFFNVGGNTIPIYRNVLGITTGIGMSWLNLRLDHNTRLTDVNGVTGVFPAPEDVYYSTSRLMIVRINVPLLLEWQPVMNGRNKMFLSAGIVGGVKTYSSYLVKHKESRKTVKEKDRGLNTRPLYLDYMVQAGYGDWGVYAKYSPIGIFQKDKGPDVKAVSLGIRYFF